MEKGVFSVKPYSLITNTRSNSRRCLTDYEKEWNLPAQSLILPSLAYKDYSPSEQHSHSNRSTPITS